MNEYRITYRTLKAGVRTRIGIGPSLSRAWLAVVTQEYWSGGVAAEIIEVRNGSGQLINLEELHHGTDHQRHAEAADRYAARVPEEA